MKVFWQIDSHDGERWCTLDSGEEKLDHDGHGWIAVAEGQLFETTATSDPRWNPRNHRVLLWPGGLMPHQRTLESQLYAYYSETGSWRVDAEDATTEDMADLLAWDSLGGFNVLKTSLGNTFVLTPHNRLAVELYSVHDLRVGVRLFREGWLAALSRHATFSGLSPSEEAALVDGARDPSTSKTSRRSSTLAGSMPSRFGGLRANT